MRRSSNSFVFPVQVSQIFFGICVSDPEWSVVLHAESRSTRVLQNEEDDTISNLIDLDTSIVMDAVNEDEDVAVDGDDGVGEAWGQNLTDEDFLPAPVVDEEGAPQLEDEVLEDDTLVDSGVVQDGVRMM